MPLSGVIGFSYYKTFLRSLKKMVSCSVRGSVVLPLAIVGLLGNLFVILIIAAKRRLHTMHYFLLANLSLSDFFLNIIITFNAISFISGEWVFGLAWCKGTLYLFRCFVLATILLLCAVTWECHTAVVTPYQFSSEITVKKVIIVFILWVASFLFAVVLLVDGVKSVTYTNPNHQCELVFRSSSSFVIMLIIGAMIFTIPFGLICKQQYQIHQAAKHQKNKIAQQQHDVNANNPGENQPQRFMKNVKDSKDAFVIVVAFLVSYLPLFVVTYLRVRLAESNTLYNAWFSATVLIQAGSMCNPVIYCIRKRQFRRQCLKILPVKCFTRISPQANPQ